MIRRRALKFLLGLLLAMAFCSTAHATIIDYVYTFNLTLSAGNAYNLDTAAYATVSFTIDSTSGNTSVPGLSMHYSAIDSSFTMSLEIGDFSGSGITYSYGVTDDPSNSTGFYPSVTLNTSDWSINTIDFTITDEMLNDMVILIIEAGQDTDPTENIELTAATVALSLLEIDEHGNYIIPTDEDGNITLKEVAGELELVNYDSVSGEYVEPVSANNFSETTGTREWSSVPEPATFSLFGLGLFGWAWIIRKKSLK